MKYLCDACERLIPPASFRMERGVLLLTCSRCGADTLHEPEEAEVSPPAPRAVAEPLAPAAPHAAPARPEAPTRKVVPFAPPVREGVGDRAPAAQAAPFMVPPGFCLKCIAPRRPGAVSCSQCGLVYERFVAEEHRPSAELAEAWELLLARWEDAGAHDELLRLAMGWDELPAIGRLYRIRLAWAPEDAMALRGRDELLRRVTTAAGASLERTQPPGRAGRLKLALMVLVLGAAAGMTLFFVRYIRMALIGH